MLAGIYWFSLLDWYTAWYPLFFLEVLQGVIVAYVYGVRRFSVDVETMVGHPISSFWKICWLAISPAVLFFVLLINLMQYSNLHLGHYTFPSWAQFVGWSIMIIGENIIQIFRDLLVC